MDSINFMTDEDTSKLRRVLKDELAVSENRVLGEVRRFVKEEITASGKRVLGEVRQFVKEEITTSESRVLGEVRQIVKAEVTASEKRVIGEVGKFVEDNLFPMIEEKADKSDIERLERKVDLFTDKTGELSKRVTNIESIPAIAHELKLKNHK